MEHRAYYGDMKGPDKKKEPPFDQASYDAFDKALAGDKNQFTVVPDYNHSDTARLAFLADPRAAQIMGQHGFKELVIERPAGCQDLADKLAAGTISDNAFVEQMSKSMVLSFQSKPEEIAAFHKKTAELIVNMHKQGIRVRFGDADTEGQWKARHAVDAEEAEIDKRMQRYKGLEPDSPAYQAARANEIAAYEQKNITDVRARGDREQTVPHIKETVGNRKTMVYYGKEHVVGGTGDGGDMTRGLSSKPKDGKAPSMMNADQRNVTQIDLTPSFEGRKMDVERKGAPNALIPQLVMGAPAFAGPSGP